MSNMANWSAELVRLLMWIVKADVRYHFAEEELLSWVKVGW